MWLWLIRLRERFATEHLLPGERLCVLNLHRDWKASLDGVLASAQILLSPLLNSSCELEREIGRNIEARLLYALSKIELRMYIRRRALLQRICDYVATWVSQDFIDDWQALIENPPNTPRPWGFVNFMSELTARQRDYRQAFDELEKLRVGVDSVQGAFEQLEAERAMASQAEMGGEIALRAVSSVPSGGSAVNADSLRQVSEGRERMEGELVALRRDVVFMRATVSMLEEGAAAHWMQMRLRDLRAVKEAEEVIVARLSVLPTIDPLQSSLSFQSEQSVSQRQILVQQPRYRGG